MLRLTLFVDLSFCQSFIGIRHRVLKNKQNHRLVAKHGLQMPQSDATSALADWSLVTIRHQRFAEVSEAYCPNLHRIEHLSADIVHVTANRNSFVANSRCRF